LAPERVLISRVVAGGRLATLRGGGVLRPLLPPRALLLFPPRALALLALPPRALLLPLPPRAFALALLFPPRALLLLLLRRGRLRCCCHRAHCYWRATTGVRIGVRAAGRIASASVGVGIVVPAAGIVVIGAAG